MKKSEIIKRYKWKEFQMIPENNLVDIVPVIRGISLTELDILTTWEKHFRSVGAPYVITKNNKKADMPVLTMWSENKT